MYPDSEFLASGDSEILASGDSDALASDDSDAAQVGNWGRLKSLDLARNRVPFLPAAVAASTNLRRLLLDANPLVQVRPKANGSIR